MDRWKRFVSGDDGMEDFGIMGVPHWLRGLEEKGVLAVSHGGACTNKKEKSTYGEYVSDNRRTFM